MPTAQDLGQTGINATTQYNKPAAAANAAAQGDTAHAVIMSHLTAAHDTATDPNVKAALASAINTASASRQTTDPTTGQVTATTNGGAPLSAFQTADANKAAGLNTTYDQKPGATIYSGDGTTGTAGQNYDQQSLIESLRNRGITDDAIRGMINDPVALSKALRVNNGTATGGSSTSNLDKLNAQISQETNNGVSHDPAKLAADRAAAVAADKAAADSANAATKAQGDASALSSAAGTKAAGTTGTTPGQLPTNTADSTVNGLNSNYNQDKTDATNLRNAELQGGTVDGVKVTGINDAFAKSDADLATLTKQANDAKAANDAQAKQDAEDQMHLLDLQKQQAEYDRTVQEQTDLMKNADDQKKAVDDTIAALCLTGQAGSTAGLLEIAQVDQKFNTNYLTITQAFQHDMGPGGKIAVTYAAGYVKASTDYHASMTANTKELITQLTTIEGQQRTTDQARLTATDSVLEKFTTAMTATRKEYTTALDAHNKEMEATVAAKTKADAVLKAQAETNRIKEEAINAAKSGRQDAITARNQAHADALMQHGDTVAAKEIDTWTKTGRQWAKTLTDDIGKDSSIKGYDDFQPINNRWDAITKNGTLTSTNPETTTLLTDLFANANNPKLTARMPSATIEIFNSNLSPADKAKTFMTKFMGGGSMDAQMLKGMNEGVKAMNVNLQSSAQDSMNNFIVKAIHQNSTIPAPYRSYGIDTSDLLHNGLTVKSTLPGGGLGNMNSDAEKKPPNDSDIMNGSTPDSSNGSFSPSEKMKGGVQATIGTRTVTAAPEMMTALQAADAAMFKDTGEHLQVNSDFRTTAQQQQAYNDMLSGKIARAAAPGSSLHEKGLAADITNWKKAEPYLVAAGLSPLGPVGSRIRSEDPAHFQFGGSVAGSAVADSSASDPLIAMAMSDDPSFDSSQ